MCKIEDILNKNTNNTINLSIFNDHRKFGYDSKELLYIDLEFLAFNVYNTIIVDNSKIRLNQKEFRSELLNKYGKCIISGNSCVDELEACHLVEVKDGGDYYINNGIILEANLHKTFDKYFWCINPFTKMIEVKDNINSSINKYKNMVIDIDIDNSIIDNLTTRYEKYILNKNA
jgi:predicted restriction endonuclease